VGPAWPRARAAPTSNGLIANLTRSWRWLPPINTASGCENAMAKSAATYSPFSNIPTRHPTITAVNENCARQPLTERSPADFDPSGAPICSPISAPSSAPQRDTASMPTTPYMQSYVVRPCSSRVEQIQRSFRWQTNVGDFHSAVAARWAVLVEVTGFGTIEDVRLRRRL